MLRFYSLDDFKTDCKGSKITTVRIQTFYQAPNQYEIGAKVVLTVKALSNEVLVYEEFLGGCLRNDESEFNKLKTKVDARVETIKAELKKAKISTLAGVYEG